MDMILSVLTELVIGGLWFVGGPIVGFLMLPFYLLFKLFGIV